MLRNQCARSLRVTALAVLASVTCLVNCGEGAELDEASRTKIYQELKAKWKSQRELLKTAHVKFRRYRNGGEFVNATPARFAKTWMEHKLDAGPDGLTPLIEELTGKPPHTLPPWSEGNFFWDVSRVREQTSTWDLLNDGDLELIKENHREVIKVYLPGVGESRWMQSTMKDFRFVPSEAFLRLHQFRVADKAGAVVELVSKNGLLRMKTASDSGQVSRLEYRDKNDAIVSELRQSGWQQHAAGVLFPKVACQAKYFDGNLETLTYVRIDEAEVNEILPASSFRMGIDKGGVIHDRRPGKSQDYVVPEPTEDIRTLIGTEETLGAAHPRSIMTFVAWLISANVIAVGAVVWWRRRVEHPQDKD